MYKVLLILAVCIRLILMPISVHSDLFFINSFPALMIKKNVFDIFSYFTVNLPYLNYTYYPPLVYLTFGFFQYIYALFSSTFSNWMFSLYQLETSSFQGQAADFIRTSPNVNIYKDLFLAKVPYLIFDVLTVIALFTLIKNRTKSKMLALVWLFNPVHLYSTYLMGQFEIIPALFVLLGLLFLRKRLFLGFFVLGIAAAYKDYAFIFIMIAALIYGETWKQRIKLVFVSIIPYLVVLLPTLIAHPSMTFFSFFPKVYLKYRKPLYGWGLYSQYIKYLILSISIICIFCTSHFLKLKNKWKLTINLSLIAILLVYSFAPRISFHYLMWELTLLLLWVKTAKQYVWIITIQSLSLASYKLLANHLQIGLLSPLNNNFALIPALNSQINQLFPYSIISNTGFFVFFFFNIYLASKIMIDLFMREQTV